MVNVCPSPAPPKNRRGCACSCISALTLHTFSLVVSHTALVGRCLLNVWHLPLLLHYHVSGIQLPPILSALARVALVAAPIVGRAFVDAYKQAMISKSISSCKCTLVLFCEIVLACLPMPRTAAANQHLPSLLTRAIFNLSGTSAIALLRLEICY